MILGWGLSDVIVDPSLGQNLQDHGQLETKNPAVGASTHRQLYSKQSLVASLLSWAPWVQDGLGLGGLIRTLSAGGQLLVRSVRLGVVAAHNSVAEPDIVYP